MNPRTFYRSMVEEDPQEFIDKVYMILLVMGLSTSEKAEMATYQLKDVSQAWFMQLRDNSPFRGVPFVWEIFKKAFLDRFFPREMREAKLVDFINLHQGGISVHLYSLKFTKFSKYAPSLVFDPRDEMSHFVTGVWDHLQEECHSAMLHDNMNISHIMVHAKHVEESRAKRKSRYTKRARSFNGGSSKNRLEIQDKPRFKKRVSSLVSSKFLKASGDRVSNPMFKKVKGNNFTNQEITCGKYRKKHYGDCLKGTDNFFCCGKVGTRLGIDLM